MNRFLLIFSVLRTVAAEKWEFNLWPKESCGKLMPMVARGGFNRCRLC